MWAKSLENNSSKWGTPRRQETLSIFDPVKTAEYIRQIEEQWRIAWEELDQLKKRQENPKQLRQIPLSLDALEKSWLESNNFRVDSSKWEMWLDLLSEVEFLINPEKDIIELKVDWKKEQLFTQEAAIRETQKYGKKLPTKLDWQKISASYWQDWERLSKELWLKPVGYWDWPKKKFYLDNMAHFWAIDSNDKLGYSIHFDRSNILINQINNTKNFLPVRSLKD
ncbi:MAG: hypothetical protein ACD_49C00038G0010 [uncultured bacterium (gcode 4)]|uniref:Uncharacterized protein n=1 Tax=uncultured bacterium (gcode 4) TaxID=1234023 RepID=K2AXI0_9BACT|nr:MAG: hypothetical protein ACD_49C00038G0010 [uncultured bacterium (gcode 4)]